MLKGLMVVLIYGASVACQRAGNADTLSADSVPPTTVLPPASDSTTSMDMLLRQFQAGLARADSLGGTSRTREALTRRYLDAVARFDTSALRAMHVTRSEYAYVYFPSSKMMKPPYELPPDAAWLLHSAESNKGIGRVMQRFGGQRLRLESVRCAGEPLREGPHTVWRECVVRYRGEGTGVRERPLFAAIIEREGRFKFFSYGTTL